MFSALYESHSRLLNNDLQSGNIIHLYIVASRCQRVQLDVPETFRAQYGGDFSYQSPDHVYDSLWNETDKSVIVTNPADVEDGNWCNNHA